MAANRITLKKGVNRLVIIAKAREEDIEILPVFKNETGKYMTNLQYRLTIDEVEPK